MKEINVPECNGSHDYSAIHAGLEVECSVCTGEAEKLPAPSAPDVGVIDILHWSDFLDTPGYGKEHPDYPAAVELFHKVEIWLTMDRKQLVAALIELHNDAVYAKQRLSKFEAVEQKPASPHAITPGM